MPDMAEFERARQSRHTIPKIVLILGQREVENPERHAALWAALREPEYSSAGIARVVRGWGCEVSEDGIQKWRKNRL